MATHFLVFDNQISPFFHIGDVLKFYWSSILPRIRLQSFHHMFNSPVYARATFASSYIAITIYIARSVAIVSYVVIIDSYKLACMTDLSSFGIWCGGLFCNHFVSPIKLPRSLRKRCWSNPKFIAITFADCKSKS